MAIFIANIVEGEKGRNTAKEIRNCSHCSANDRLEERKKDYGWWLVRMMGMF